MAVTTLLARRPDLAGIHVAGGGMAVAIAALPDARVGGRVALVVSALTDLPPLFLPPAVHVRESV